MTQHTLSAELPLKVEELIMLHRLPMLGNNDIPSGRYAIHIQEELIRNVLSKAFAQAVSEAEISLARKIYSVARQNSPYKPKGATMKKRLELIEKKMLEIVPNDFGIEELTPPSPERKQDA